MRHTLAAFVLLLLSFASQAQQAPTSPPTEQEQKLFDLTNQARSDHGLQPLQWDAALAAAARAHAQKMVDQRSLSHQLPDEADLAARAGQAGAHFHTIAENIAMGPGADAVQKQWLNSPPHRANILDPALDHIGIGVVEQRGYWYAVVDFDSSVAALQPSEVEQQIAGLLRQKGIDPSGSADDARKDCAIESGDVSGSRPLFVMRWQGPALNRLPAPLEQRLSSGKYKTAAVGACSSEDTGSQGFTTYRIAVLLY